MPTPATLTRQRAALLATAATYHLTGERTQRDELLGLVSKLDRGEALSSTATGRANHLAYHRGIDVWRVEQRVERRHALYATWADVAHAYRLEPTQESLGLVRFFAGVEEAACPLVEVCTRLARWYEQQAPIYLSAANLESRAAWALVRRARLQCGERVAYDDRDAQHVRRVLERMASWPKEDWTDLDCVIFERMRRLPGRALVG